MQNNTPKHSYTQETEKIYTNMNKNDKKTQIHRHTNKKECKTDTKNEHIERHTNKHTYIKSNTVTYTYTHTHIHRHTPTHTQIHTHSCRVLVLVIRM